MSRMSDRKSRLPEGDDGRTIAPMNVDGMPWYRPERAENGEGRETEPRKSQGKNDFPLSRSETRYYTWGALKAALLVVGVLCAGIVLFVLFCLHVWFR